MQKLWNVVVAALAAGVCIFITVLTMDTDIYSMAFNLVVLGIMLVITLFAGILGFGRMAETARGLDAASRKLVAIFKNKGNKEEITAAGTRIFEVDYLDRKYQEYLAYLRKTNSPCDIGDYIGEYEINNYTHRRLVEMVPDILTSLGILGTFLGLVWGLKGFDPVSYEAMTSSVSSLIDGIKVAFVTSIYGITLSMAFSFWMRGALSRVSESLDNFQDKYYLCAVPPTDATAMNHVIDNQKQQIQLARDMSKEMTEQLAAGFERYMEPAMEHMNKTLDHFTDVVTLNQEELMERISTQVMESMKTELMEEFSEMRGLLGDTNRVQRDYVRFLSELQQTQGQFQQDLMEVRTQFQQDFLAGEEEITRAMQTAGSSQEECLAAMKTQQENLMEFVEYMSKVMERMARLNEASVQTLEEVTKQIEELSQDRESQNMEGLNSRLDRLIEMMEKQQSRKKGFFR